MTTVNELLFFDSKPDALALYEAFREVSFAPVRKAKDRPKSFLTITFGLAYRKESDRIDAAVEAYPNRWTHHVMIGSVEEVDEELLSWIVEAAEFAKNMKR